MKAVIDSLDGKHFRVHSIPGRGAYIRYSGRKEDCEAFLDAYEKMEAGIRTVPSALCPMRTEDAILQGIELSINGGKA